MHSDTRTSFRLGRILMLVVMVGATVLAGSGGPADVATASDEPPGFAVSSFASVCDPTIRSCAYVEPAADDGTSTEYVLAPATLPASFDWRDYTSPHRVSPVRDQGEADVGYAFAAVANAEWFASGDGAPAGIDYSEDQAIECTWRAQNASAGGGYVEIANHWSQMGISTEATNPYTDADGTCHSPDGPWETTLLGWQRLSRAIPPTTTTIKQLLMDQGPLYTGIYIGEEGEPWREEFEAYDGSYTLDGPQYEGATNHNVLIVGWDDNESVYGDPAGAWIAKNSWGTEWGDAGYFRITYGRAALGAGLAVMTDSQPYDEHGDLWFYDEAGGTNGIGYMYVQSVWGTNVFTATEETYITRVEFWTVDEFTNVDIFLYDSFDGSSPSGLLAQIPGKTIPREGYYSMPLAEPLRVTAGEDVAVMMHLTTTTNDTAALAVDSAGPSSGNSYRSANGTSWSTWDDDISLRLRTSTKPVDLDLTKSVAGDSFGPGDPITYTLAIENLGTAAAASAVLTDILPAEVVDPIVVNSDHGITGIVDYVWSLDPLSAGDTAVVTITGVVSVTDSQHEFTNEATVHDPLDGRLSNNRSAVAVNLDRVYLPCVVRSVGPPRLRTMRLYAIKDQSVAELQPTYHYDGNDLIVGIGWPECSTFDDGIARSFIEFDLSSLSVSAVESAELHLHESGWCPNDGAPPATITVYRLTQPWVERGTYWPTQPAWAESHGSFDVDIDDWTWSDFSHDVTGLVNLWVQGTPNCGLLLRGPETDDANRNLVYFSSRQDAPDGPYLLVTYYE